MKWIPYTLFYVMKYTISSDWKLNLNLNAQTPAPPATFDPWLPQNSQKIDSQPIIKVPCMIDFARRESKKKDQSLRLKLILKWNLKILLYKLKKDHKPSSKPLLNSLLFLTIRSSTKKEFHDHILINDWISVIKRMIICLLIYSIKFLNLCRFNTNMNGQGLSYLIKV